MNSALGTGFGAATLTCRHLVMGDQPVDGRREVLVMDPRDELAAVACRAAESTRTSCRSVSRIPPGSVLMTIAERSAIFRVSGVTAVELAFPGTRDVDAESPRGRRIGLLTAERSGVRRAALVGMGVNRGGAGL